MNFLFLNIALCATLIYYVSVLRRQKNLRLIFILLLSIAALPELTNLLDHEEALTFSCAFLAVASFLSLIKLPLTVENLQVRVLSRLLTVSLFMTLCSMGFAYYNQRYPQYYAEQVQIGILAVFSIVGFIVFTKALK
jgi:hypothetical protein